MTLTGDRPADRSDRSAADEAACAALDSPSDVVAVLRPRRRREVLRCVLAADGPVAVQTLVRRLAEAETDPTLETTLLQQCQRVYESLCRTHLPVLDEYGIVEYHPGRGFVLPAAGLLAFEPLFDDAGLGRPE